MCGMYRPSQSCITMTRVDSLSFTNPSHIFSPIPSRRQVLYMLRVGKVADVVKDKQQEANQPPLSPEQADGPGVPPPPLIANLDSTWKQLAAAQSGGWHRVARRGGGGRGPCLPEALGSAGRSLLPPRATVVLPTCPAPNARHGSLMRCTGRLQLRLAFYLLLPHTAPF